MQIATVTTSASNRDGRDDVVEGASAGERVDAVSRFAQLQAAVLALATGAMALIAGFFYAYACSVMVGLARADDRTFVVAMQWINATVRNAAFAPSFFGALLLTAVAVALFARERRTGVLPWLLGGLLLYAAAFAITFGISVPLNDELAAAGHPDRLTASDLAAVRDRYEDTWVRWNIVRTAASTAALVCLLRALVVFGRRTKDEGLGIQV